MKPREALFRPMRLRILESLAGPDTAAGVARRLRVARQKVNYHLRALEKDPQKRPTARELESLLADFVSKRTLKLESLPAHFSGAIGV